MLVYAIAKCPKGHLLDPLACELDVTDSPLHDLGGGFRAYLVDKPYPGIDSCVVCSRTGTIFGGTLKHVMDGIRENNIQDSNHRWKTGIRVRDLATEISPDQFWPWIIKVLTMSGKSV